MLDLFINLLSKLDSSTINTALICIAALLATFLLLVAFFPKFSDRIVCIIDAFAQLMYSIQERPHRRFTSRCQRGRKGGKK